MIHVAITRTVRPGHEAEFEQRLKEFFLRTSQEHGTGGAFLIRPLQAKKPREYGIIRSFEDSQAMQRFYDSSLYESWNSEVKPLVEGDPARHELHGLEAFFRRSGGPPPAWKMALLTWVAVNPAVFVFSTYLGPLLSWLPGALSFLVVNAFVVASLTWLLMPSLTRLSAAWLRPEP